MTNYINENSQYSLPNSICNCTLLITIKKELFLNHLTKRQQEMIKNNDKTKLLKTLKHMEFPNNINEELKNVFSDKIYLLNDTILTQNNYLKNIFKYWEKEIENFKLLKDEINSISDINILEIINADKIGYLSLIDENQSLNTITITASFGNTNQNKDIYKIKKETNDISKELGTQTTYFIYENEILTEKNIPDKKMQSQVFSDTEILKLCNLSKHINEYFGTYKNIEFVSLNNKIYITNITEVKVQINKNTLSKDILWQNNFTDIKNATTPLSFSIENIFFKSTITALSDIFYTYTPTQNSLVFYNNHILNDANIIDNMIKNSGVYLFNPLFFEQFFLNKPISNEKYNNSIYFMEAIRCYSKLYTYHNKINKKHEHFLNKINYLLNKYNDLSTLTLESLLVAYKEIEETINLIWTVTVYNDIFLNIYTNMIKRKLKVETFIFSDNTLLQELNKLSKSISTEVKDYILIHKDVDINNYLKQYPSIKADIDIFINTYKNKYFSTLQLEEEYTLLNIYDILINWEYKKIEDKNIDFNKNKIAKRYSTCKKRQESYYEIKNILYQLLNSLFKEIGTKLMLSGYITFYKDIYYLTADEIINYTQKIIEPDLLNTIIEKRKNTNIEDNIHTDLSFIPKYNLKGTIKKINKNNIMTLTENDIAIINTIDVYTICSLPKVKGIIIDSLTSNSYIQWLIELLEIPYVEIFNANNILNENEEFEI